jgi:hypothetical protein
MADQRGWPNATKPGTPETPDQEGPHLIEDEHGTRYWYWWLPDAARRGDAATELWRELVRRATGKD